MKLIKFFNTNKHLIDTYIQKNKARIIYLIVFAIALFFVAKLPYLNIFLNIGVMISIILVISMFVLQLNIRFYFITGVICIFLSMGMLILGETKHVELLGNLLYGCLAVGIITKLRK